MGSGLLHGRCEASLQVSGYLAGELCSVFRYWLARGRGRLPSVRASEIQNI